jgi:hypothetical protein
VHDTVRAPSSGEAARRKKLAIAAIESANEVIKRWCARN